MNKTFDAGVMHGIALAANERKKGEGRMSGVPYNFETNTLREVKKTSDIPEGKSYLIQFYENESIYHEGDERSKRYPGHGYPAYTEHRLNIRQFVTRSREEWGNAAKSLFIDGKRSDVLLLSIERVGVTIRTEITI